MLTRLYIDNYRALVNCELVLGARTLLMGRNGTGKSTFGEVLVSIQLLLIAQSKLEDLIGADSVTRWQRVPRQTFELDVSAPQGQFRYRLVIEHRDVTGPDQPRVRVVTEWLTLNGSPLFQFEDGVIQLVRDDGSRGSEYPFDWGRSGLGTISPRHEHTKITWFLNWVRALTVLRPNPQLVEDLVENASQFFLFERGQNFAAWYHTASAADKRRDQKLHESLAAVLPGFDALNFEFAGPNRWLLRADFVFGTTKLLFRFRELSDGQRSLILLYAVLYFLLGNGGTVFLDEPDNYVALDEIQPWLLAATDIVDDGQGQLLLISHHPEIYNQWAVSRGIVTDRDGCGPVRVHRFSEGTELGLSPAESIARGWALASNETHSISNHGASIP